MQNLNEMNMKKFLLIMAMVVGIATASARDKYSHDINTLPTAAQTTLKNNFKASVSHIKIDKELGRVSEYDVVLTDGSEISFDRNGNWKDVEVRKSGSVPSSFVPTAIANYIKKTQKNVKVIGIEKKKSGYEVELSNGVDMKFNSKGEFLRHDD